MKFVLSLLAALAVLLMPYGMSGKVEAMQASHDMGTAGDMGHCADKPEPAKDQPPESCCVLACSTLSAEPADVARLTTSLLAHTAAAPVDLYGLSAEAATPPPRSA